MIHIAIIRIRGIEEAYVSACVLCVCIGNLGKRIVDKKEVEEMP